MKYKQLIVIYIFFIQYIYVQSIDLFTKFKQRFVKNTTLTYISENNIDLHNKKIITISPGGFKGFYVLGICKYIKKHYDLTDYVFSGASAGAWNSLLLSFKGDIDLIENDLLSNIGENVNNLYKIESSLKKELLQKYSSEDFDIDKLFIGTTVFENYSLKGKVYSGFENLDDVLDCCIASSHIPFITGWFKKRYRGLACFDGGFSEYPYINNEISAIHITPNIFKNQHNGELEESKLNIDDFTTIFSRKTYDTNQLVQQGYNDAKLNKEYIDSLFIKNITT